MHHHSQICKEPKIHWLYDAQLAEHTHIIVHFGNDPLMEKQHKFKDMYSIRLHYQLLFILLKAQH